MSKKDLIKKLEMERSSRVITYVTSDRAPFATKIASDIFTILLATPFITKNIKSYQQNNIRPNFCYENK